MKKDILLSITLALLAALFYNNRTAAQTNAGLTEAKLAIAKSNDIYFTAFVKNDSSIFINRYAKDCCIMAPGGEAMCGEGAPLAFFKMAYNQVGLRNGKFITTQVYGDGLEYVTEEGL